MVDRRIASQMVAQDAGTKTQSLDRLGPQDEVIPYVLYVAVLFLCSDVARCVSSSGLVRSRVARGVWCLA